MSSGGGVGNFFSLLSSDTIFFKHIHVDSKKTIKIEIIHMSEDEKIIQKKLPKEGNLHKKLTFLKHSPGINPFLNKGWWRVLSFLPCSVHPGQKMFELFSACS